MIRISLKSGEGQLVEKKDGLGRFYRTGSNVFLREYDGEG